MAISVSTALALLALAVAVFALLAVGGVYGRLKQAERALADMTFGEIASSMPEELRPRDGAAATVVLTLDGECPTCHQLAAAVDAAVSDGVMTGLRVVRMFATEESRGRHTPSDLVETYADPDLWTAVYEGYTPTVSIVDRNGRVVHRRFVYPDTDLGALVRDLRARAGVTDHSASLLVPQETS